eukprot:scaffold84201_cov32-Tisochrysis_lutea.AAC.2
MAVSRDRLAGKGGSGGNFFSSSQRSVPTHGISDCGTVGASTNFMPAQVGAEGSRAARFEWSKGLITESAGLLAKQLPPWRVPGPPLTPLSPSLTPTAATCECGLWRAWAAGKRLVLSKDPRRPHLSPNEPDERIGCH